MASWAQIRCTNCDTYYDSQAIRKFDHPQEKEEDEPCPVSQHPFYCRSCIEQLPSPQTCPTCQATLIDHTATRNIPIAALLDVSKTLDRDRTVIVISAGQHAMQPTVTVSQRQSEWTSCLTCILGTICCVVVIWLYRG